MAENLAGEAPPTPCHVFPPHNPHLTPPNPTWSTDVRLFALCPGGDYRTMAPVDKPNADGTDPADKPGTAVPDAGNKTADSVAAAPAEKSGKPDAVPQDVGSTVESTTAKLKDTGIFSEYYARRRDRRVNTPKVDTSGKCELRPGNDIRIIYFHSCQRQEGPQANPPWKNFLTRLLRLPLKIFSKF